jgi:H+/gluconate symporter-like permease
MEKPTFHVNLTKEEWEELQQQEEEERIKKIRDKQTQEATLFFAKFILPVILIVVGAFSIKQNGWIILIIGIVYLALMVYLEIQESKPKSPPKKSSKHNTGKRPKKHHK